MDTQVNLDGLVNITTRHVSRFKGSFSQLGTKLDSYLFEVPESSRASALISITDDGIGNTVYEITYTREPTVKELIRHTEMKEMNRLMDKYWSESFHIISNRQKTN